MGNKTRNTSNLVSDNNIFVDISNDHVGIGSTQPTTKLDVVGTIKATSFSGITTAMISDYGNGLAGGYSNTNVDSHINVGTANTGEVLSWDGTDYDWVVVGVDTANINADTLNVSGVSTFQDVVSISGAGNTATITGPSNLVLDPAVVGDATGTVTILGNLQVDGTQTIINSTTLEVDDKLVSIAKSATNATQADGAGLEINGASATFTYAYSGDKWVANKSIEATSFIKNGGTSTEFLKADGSVDTNTYLTSETQTLDDVVGLGSDTIQTITVGTATTGVVVRPDGSLSVSGIATFQDSIVLTGVGKSLVVGPSDHQLILEHDPLGAGVIRQNSDLFLCSPGIVIGAFDVTATGNRSADFFPNGSVNLYHYGNQKFQTTSSGITVTGRTQTQQLNVSGISTFGSDVDINADVNVSGIVTATTFSGDGASLINVDATTAYSADLSTLATTADNVSGKITYTEFDQISQVDQPAGTPVTTGGSTDYDFHAMQSYLSKDGKTLFSVRMNNNTAGSSVVTIYERNQSGFNYVGFLTETTYATVGAAQTVTHWGPTVTSSADGSIFAIGSPDGFDDANAREKYWFLQEVGGGTGSSTGSQQSVHIYQRTGSNIESLGIITAGQYGLNSIDRNHPLDSDGADGFGLSMAFSNDGSKLYIGAPEYFRTPDPYSTTASDFVRGRVYAFDKSGSSYNFVGIITQTRDSTNNDDGNKFGISIACSSDGNKLYIGDSHSGFGTDGNPTFSSSEREGVVYAYDRSGSNFSCVGIISTGLFPVGTSVTVYGSSQFGFDVACSDDGNTIVIGSPRMTKADASGSTDAGGAIHVVSRSGNSFSASGRHIHTAADGGNQPIGSQYYFGRTIACNSDATKILTSKWTNTNQSLGDYGETWVYSRSGSDLNNVGILTSPRETSDANMLFAATETYGSSLSIDSTGDTIGIGAPGHVVPGETLNDAGAVFLFSGSRQIALHGNQITNNIGIGTTNTNPIATLDVDGTLNVSSVSTFLDNVRLGIGTNGSNITRTYNTDINGDSDVLSITSVNDKHQIVQIGFSTTTGTNPFTANLQFEGKLGNTLFDYKPLIEFKKPLAIGGVGLEIGYNSGTISHSWLNTDGSQYYSMDNNGDKFIILRDDAGSYPSSVQNLIFEGGYNDGVKLYHTGNKKLETTGYGVTVTGGLNVSGISTFQDDVKFPSAGANGLGNILYDKSTGELKFSGVGVDKIKSTYNYGGDSFSVYQNLADQSLIQSNSATDLYIAFDGSTYITDQAGSNKSAVFNGTGAAELYNNNSKKLETTGYGVAVTGGLNVSGISTFSGNVNLGDDDKLRLGDSGDLQIYHTGGDSNYIDSEFGVNGLQIRTTEGNIEFKLKQKADNALKLIEDGAVELYFDNSKKLETTGAGVTVTGILTATSFVKSGGTSSQFLMADGSVSTGGGGGLSPDAQENLYAGTGAGASSDSDTYCNIALGYNAGNALNSGDHNVFLGTNAGGTSNSFCNVSIGYSAGYQSSIASKNVLIGLNAGKVMDTASQVVAIGEDAGCGVCPGGCGSVFIGYRAGASKGDSYGQSEYNVAIGYCAGSLQGSGSDFNVLIGRCAGRNLIGNSSNNILIGQNAGWYTTYSSSNNIAIGQDAAKCGTGCGSNVFIGYNSGKNTCCVQSGQPGAQSNTFLGWGTGSGITTARYNTFLGAKSGESTTDGNYNVAIGYGVTLSSPTASNEFKVGIGTEVWLRGDSSFNIYDKDGNQLNGSSSGIGSFTAIAGVAYTANTYTSSDFVTSEYTLFFEHTSGIQSQKVLVMDDETTAYSQEYAIMSSSDLLVSVGATIKSGNVELWFTPESGVSGIVTYKFTRETII